jgi:hypothetical protein
MRFLTFLFFFALGIAIMYYREPIKRFTGSMGFAESWFGAGGTYTFYALFGLLVCIGSVLWITGTLDGFFQATLGRFFFQPQ